VRILWVSTIEGLRIVGVLGEGLEIS
jgi:hypothetical protein